MYVLYINILYYIPTQNPFQKKYTKTHSHQAYGPPQTLTKLSGDAAFNNWYFAWSARKKAWCCSMQDEFIPTENSNWNMIESDARNDWIFNKENF